MNRIWADTGRAWDLYFQEEASINAIGIRDLHDNVMYYLIIIVFVVAYAIFTIINNNISYKYLNHSTLIEIIWTIIPALILIFIAIPSFKLLYTLDEIYKPLITLKIKGYQWYWGYEISDIEGVNINFESYTLGDDDLTNGQLRLLDVDERVLLPILTPIRLLISAQDVIHSFSIPCFGLKTDAIPGRINSASLFILREGTYYGQCMELCGSAHSKMSIVVQGVKKSEYIAWLLNHAGINVETFSNIVGVVKF